MARPVSFGEDFSGIFDWFGQSAFRLETLDHYAMEYEEEAVQRFLAGEPRDTSYIAGWLERVRAAVGAGRRMQRVHVVTEPLSDYLRFEIGGYRLNVEAGEDVRILPRQATAGLDLPDHDFWLFDGQQVVRMRYDASGAFLGAEQIDDRGAAARYGAWRDAALGAAIPYGRYVAEHRQELETLRSAS
jgi:hypothetical protein